MDDNPLLGTGTDTSVHFRNAAVDADYTVEELVEAIDQEEYSADQLQALKEIESREKDRKTAHKALDAALEDSETETGELPTSDVAELETEAESPDTTESESDEIDDSEDSMTNVSNAEANSSNESPAVQRAVKGAGATNAGDDPLNLPNPRSDNAPDMVRIVVDGMAVGFAGGVYESGVHNVEYDLRTKQALESTTNEIRLSTDDPLYPDKVDSEE